MIKKCFFCDGRDIWYAKDCQLYFCKKCRNVFNADGYKVETFYHPKFTLKKKYWNKRGK